VFSTSLMAAVTGFVMAATPSPAWQSDYRTVLSLSAELHKPVAVLIGRGDAGKQVPAEAALALRQHFVCLYVDVATPAGQELSAAFQLGEGLVISDKSGTAQALRHAGAVAPADLSRYATRYAHATGVTKTEYVNTTAVVADQPVPPPATYAAPVVNYAPAMNYAPMYQPYPVMGGGCANGRCGSSPCANGRCGR